jgi:hypothetical protein
LFRIAVFDDPSLEITGHENLRYTTEKAVCVDVSHNPRVLFHVQKCLNVGISAIRQSRSEDVRQGRLTRDEGGSGIGKMELFEIMRATGASLYIEELDDGRGFTKRVSVRFDGNGEFVR